MPKLKTNKSASKRFRVTKSGKIKRTMAGKSHLMVGTRKKTVRKLRGRTLVHEADLAKVARMLVAE
ncbi:MAG TPA: 50S ribosomal protein L35 [Planctomycetota bacterium]|nr:50S ribosomal protein L35 [Planctomycetota bacterium]